MHSWESRIDYLLFYAAEFRPSLMIKILRSNSISNGLRSKYNTGGLNILRWKMTPRSISTRIKIFHNSDRNSIVGFGAK